MECVCQEQLHFGYVMLEMSGIHSVGTQWMHKSEIEEKVQTRYGNPGISSLHLIQR